MRRPRKPEGRFEHIEVGAPVAKGAPLPMPCTLAELQQQIRDSGIDWPAPRRFTSKRPRGRYRSKLGPALTIDHEGIRTPDRLMRWTEMYDCEVRKERGYTPEPNRDEVEGAGWWLWALGGPGTPRVIYDLWRLGYRIWRRFAHAGEPYALAVLVIHPPPRVLGPMPGVTNVPLEIVLETESGSRERMAVIRGLVGEACDATRRFYALRQPDPGP